MDFAILDRRINRTLFIDIGRSVGFRMVNQFMLTVSDHLFGGVSGHSLRRRIHKGGLAFGIETVNSLTRRLQDQLVQVADPFQCLIRRFRWVLVLESIFMPAIYPKLS